MTEQQTSSGAHSRPLPELPDSAYPANARKRYQLIDPDDLSLGQAMGIKAATGIDVFDPDSTAQQLAGLVWYAGRADGLTIQDAMLYTANDFDLPGTVAEPDVDPFDPETSDAETDPTAGSDTASA